ncbi:MAG: hypothetical protein AB1801_22805 [Chloroflexota bacterium]
MNTERSKKKATEFLTKGNNLQRKIQTYEKTFPFPPEKVFFQFCPARELDWIAGWDCDLVYTSTGYVEEDCIFTTPDTNLLGPGLWILTRYEPNRKLELVRIIGATVVIHFRINLIDNNDGTATGVWNLTFTALNEAGNTIVEAIPANNSELERAIAGLEYFLKTGEMMTATRTEVRSIQQPDHDGF